MIKKIFIKVPEITIYFWIIKILSTTVGETAADFVNVDLGLGLLHTTVLMGIITVGSVIWQFKMKKYFAPAYWFLIVMMSIEGTLITDLLVDDFGVSLITLDIIFTILMLGLFGYWYKTEGTLSIHSIYTKKRESFYWLIVLMAFALGTGVGDTVSEYLAVGYSYSLLIFMAIFILAVVFSYAKVLDKITAFWIAFIVTRPIGASLGDLMIQAPKDGGLGIGNGIVNILFFMVILGLITYLTITKLDVSLTDNNHD